MQKVIKMRIDTTGKKAYRGELYEKTADTLGENTKVGGLDRAAELANHVIPALMEANQHPDMTDDLREVLSSRYLELTVDRDLTYRLSNQNGVLGEIEDND